MPGSLSFRFPHQNPADASPLPHMCYTPHPSHSSQLHHPNNIWWGVQIIKLHIKSSFLHSLVTSSLLGPNILLIALFSNNLSLRSFLNLSDQFSHPYETTGKIIVLYILIFKFFISNWKTKYSAPNESLCLTVVYYFLPFVANKHLWPPHKANNFLFSEESFVIVNKLSRF